MSTSPSPTPPPRLLSGRFLRKTRRTAIAWHVFLLFSIGALAGIAWHFASHRLPAIEESLLLREEPTTVPEATRQLFLFAQQSTRSPWPITIVLGLLGMLEWITFWKRSWETTNLLLLFLCLAHLLLFLTGYLVLVPILFQP